MWRVYPRVDRHPSLLGGASKRSAIGGTGHQNLPGSPNLPGTSYPAGGSSENLARGRVRRTGGQVLVVRSSYFAPL